MLCSPLEQFGIYKLISLSLFGFDLSFTNSSLLAVLSCSTCFVLFSLAICRAKLIPTAWQSLVEGLYVFVYSNILAENIKKNGAFYFPVLFAIFCFILFCNLMGMVPYSFTVTSHIVVTLALSTMTFLGINIIGIKTHGFHMLSFFLPSGAPLALAPLLVAIELVSYSFRLVSLALRLFANMMSGHCLLKILAGFG
jgi:F-type H+-transporting ATPase subunit a